MAPAEAAANRLAAIGAKIHKLQISATPDASASKLNAALREAENALLSDAGLPKRPWYKHTIYAPGEYTGYAAVVIPGVNEAIEQDDPARAQAQLDILTAGLQHAAAILEDAVK
jgi:N-acetylated-alpha-linked acidic dipeptidase